MVKRGGAPDRILVLNAGSSSIKFAVFSGDLTEEISGIAEGIGGASRLRIGSEETELPFIDHRAALRAVLAALEAEGIKLGSLRAAAHRVVHGGRKLTAPVRINPDVTDLFAFTFDDFTLEGYDPHPHIKAEVAV